MAKPKVRAKTATTAPQTKPTRAAPAPARTAKTAKPAPRPEKPAGKTARAEKPTIPVKPLKGARADKPTVLDKRAKGARADKPTVLQKPAKGARADKPTVLDRPAKAAVAAVDEQGLGWIDAGKGYALSLDDGKLVAKNDKGKRLSSVPKELKDGDLADQLEALRDWLAEHERECKTTVEQWMLRSLPVPRRVLEQVWDDPAWRTPLENAVVVTVRADGGHDHGKAGLFRGVDAKKGVGVVDLDGETGWLAADRVAIPHPILIPELDTWRELVTQLGVTQGVSQLHRETYVKPPGLATSSIAQFEDGKFAMLMHAVGKARSLGYKVRGGFAVCKVFDGGTVSEARYWIGADSPDAETYTGTLSWVDERERGLGVEAVGPVAFSEGMRMASSIYAARVVEKQEGTA